MNKIRHCKVFYIKMLVVVCVSVMSIGNLHANSNLNSTLTELLQTEKVTLNISNKPIKVILDEIYKQTKISFVFKNGKDINELSNLSIKVTNATLKDVLTKLFTSTSFTYVIEGKVVSIMKKQPTPVKNSQNVKVKVQGKVVNKNNKKAVVGATVVVIGTQIGAITDESGSFSFSASSADQFEVSFTGKKSVIYDKPLNSTQAILIEIEDSVVDIEDVVVTGYANVNRADMVGTATTLRADDIKIQGKSNIADMLQGQVAGMIVTNSSSRVGATPKIQIRGQSTLATELGNQNPIWVVDGVIQDDPIQINSSLAGVDDLSALIGNQVSWLNPNDIETITVLKDASATAIYGSKASNGVIVITTKAPKDDKITVSYSGGLTINSKPKYSNFNYMNSQERILTTEELYNDGVTYREIPLKQMDTFDGLLRSYIERDITPEQYFKRRSELESMNTDWFDLLTRTAVSQDHSVSLSGRISNKLSVVASLGYNTHIGQEIKNDKTGLTGRIAITANLNKKLRINFAINGSKSSGNATAIGSSSNGGGSTPMSYAKGASRSIPAFNEDGSPCFYKVRTSYKYNDTAILGYNFMNEMEHSSATNVSGRLSMNLGLSYALTDWLKYEFSGAYTYSESTREVMRNERSFSIADSFRGYDYGSVVPNSTEYNAALMPHGGTLAEDRATGNSYNIQNKLLFSKTFNDKHRVNMMLANEVRSTRSESLSTAMWGLLPDRGNTFAKPPKNIVPITGTYTVTDYGLLEGLYTGRNGIRDQTNNFVSLFATLAYSYDDRYVLNANVRNDFSNRFGQDVNNRFDPTYSFGVKWSVSNEAYMKDVKWISSLNLSATYGVQGNALLSQSPDLILTKGGLDTEYNEFRSTVSSIPNPNLSWERTSNWDFAISGRLFEAVNFNVNYYTRESNATVNQEIGFENGFKMMRINGGIIYNNGVEFSVSFNPVAKKNFGLNISLNSSKNWNKGGMTTLAEESIINVNSYLSANKSQIVKEGYPLGSMWSFVLSHLDDEHGGARFKNMDIDPSIAKLDPTLLLTYSGQVDPFFTGGANINVRYRKFTLMSSFSLILGGNKRLPNPYTVFGSSYNKQPDSQVNMSKDLMKRWKKPGDERSTIYPGVIAGKTDIIPMPGQNNITMPSYSMWGQSDAMVANGGFLRCTNLRLQYNFESAILGTLGLSSLTIGASVSNLFVIGSKRFNGFDPELGSSVMPKNYSLSLSVGF